MPVFRRDELRDALKIFALVRPDASFVCSIKTANSFHINWPIVFKFCLFVFFKFIITTIGILKRLRTEALFCKCFVNTIGNNVFLLSLESSFYADQQMHANYDLFIYSTDLVFSEQDESEVYAASSSRFIYQASRTMIGKHKGTTSL